MARGERARSEARHWQSVYALCCFCSKQAHQWGLGEELVDLFQDASHPLRKPPHVEQSGDDPRMRLRCFALAQGALEELLGPTSALAQLAETADRLLQVLDPSWRASNGESAASRTPLAVALRTATRAKWKPMQAIEDAELRRALESLGGATQFALQGFAGSERMLLKRLQTEASTLPQVRVPGEGLSPVLAKLLLQFWTPDLEKDGTRVFLSRKAVGKAARVNLRSAEAHFRKLLKAELIEPGAAGGRETIYRLTAFGVAAVRELRKQRHR